MKFLANLTLGKKTTIFTAVGLLLGVGVFSFLGIRAVNQATEAMLQDRLTTARLVADYIDETIGRAAAELHSVSYKLEPGDGEGDFAPEISGLENTFTRLSIALHGIYLLDSQGRIIWGKPGQPQLKEASLLDNPVVNNVLHKGTDGVSGLVSAPVTNVPVVFLVGPTRSGPSGVRGAVVAAVDIAQSGIGGFIRPIRLGETGYVEIVDQDGLVVARTEPGPKLSPFERSDHSGRFAALITAGEPTQGLCHTCHEPVQRVERKDVLAFVPMTAARWGVVIRQSEEEALAPIRQLQQSLLLSGAGLLVIVFLLVFLMTRDIVGHVRMLTVSSRRIAEGDLTRRVITSRKDEIGVLAQTFDDMRVKLRASYQDLEQRTKELSSLLAVSEVLTSLFDLSSPDPVLGSALDKTLEIIQGSAAGILLPEKEGSMLCYRVYRGASPESFSGVCGHPGEGISGQVAVTGDAIVVDDISADARAGPVEKVVAGGRRALASVPLSVKNRVLGVMNVASREERKFSPQDISLLQGIARQVAAAIENAELHQELQRKEEVRGELLREIFSIQEEERRRIARELHDETSQSLASLNASLETAIGVMPRSVEKARETLRKAQDLSVSILDEIHKLIYELRPSLLDDLGLVTAIRWLAENNLESAGVAVEFEVVGREKRLPPALDTTLFRVVHETMSNISHHARAKKVRVKLHFRRDAIEVKIADDGVGFDVEEAIGSRERPRGLGLLGMRERVELVNGTLRILSRPGKGTQIDIKIPIEREVKHGQD